MGPLTKPCSSSLFLMVRKDTRLCQRAAVCRILSLLPGEMPSSMSQNATCSGAAVLARTEAMATAACWA